MAYGLQVFTANQNIMIDTEAKSSMQITQEGTHSASSNWTQQAGEFTLWNYNESATTVFNQSYNSNNIYNNSTVTAYNAIRLREVVSATPPSRSAGDYGIECYNGANTVSFTDLFLKSYKILNVWAPGTLLGGTTLYSGTVGTNIFVGAGSPSTGSGYSYSNFAFTSNSITFRNFISGFFTANLINASTVMVIQRRN